MHTWFRRADWHLLDILAAVAIVAVATQLGCHSGRRHCANPQAYYHTLATEIEYPDVEVASDRAISQQMPPNTLRNSSPQEPWHLGLDEAIQLALANSEVIQDAGGRLITAPAGAASVYDVAIQETDPRVGVEGALSAFDAQLNSSLIFQRNERTLNNAFFGGGIPGVRENTGDFQLGIAKTGAAGTQLALRNQTNFSESNSPFNRFRNAWETVFEAELRQPLLQGAGIAFNRIAGPQATPGNYQGVVLARLNTDVSLADFEAAVIDLVSNVEIGYWQLYFAYRDLDAKIAARDAALQTWQTVQARFETGAADREQEALARQQYYAAQAQVENALSGSATTGLVVTTSGGVQTVERRLRLLLGLAATDGRLIRPSNEPAVVDLAFDWEASLLDSLTRRVELRRQKWTIARREMELTAARNFQRPRLDFVGQFRRRGFGDDLAGRADVENGSAFGDLVTGDLQEWQLGLQLNTPIGNRIGHTAARNAELRLAKARAVYRKQEQQVTNELSSSFAELDRAYTVVRTNYNRRLAGHERLQAVRDKHEVGNVVLQFVLAAQSEARQADSEYYRSLVEYNLAVANLQKARGTLLDYHGVQLAEGPWSAAAHRSAMKQARRIRPRRLNYCYTVPRPVSLGAFAPLPEVVEQ